MEDLSDKMMFSRVCLQSNEQSYIRHFSFSIWQRGMISIRKACILNYLRICEAFGVRILGIRLKRRSHIVTSNRIIRTSSLDSFLMIDLGPIIKEMAIIQVSEHLSHPSDNSKALTNYMRGSILDVKWLKEEQLVKCSGYSQYHTTANDNMVIWVIIMYNLSWWLFLNGVLWSFYFNNTFHCISRSNKWQYEHSSNVN